jgi:hypothetical protein
VSASSESPTAGGRTAHARVHTGGKPPHARVHTGGKPPRACVHTGGETPRACVRALFHRYPNFAPNSMCDPVGKVARRLRNFGFEVSIREVLGSQPSNIVTNWLSGGTRGSVNLIVGGDNRSCGR